MPRQDPASRLFTKYRMKMAKNDEIFGNRSRFSTTWVGGPKNMNRKQHIPGYQGCVRGLISENLFHEPFGDTSARAIARDHPVGHDIPPKAKFISQNSRIHSHRSNLKFDY